MTNEDAELLGWRILEDADKLRLFVPEHIARFRFDYKGQEFEVLLFIPANEPSQE
jgi:hypothetical protein